MYYKFTKRIVCSLSLAFIFSLSVSLANAETGVALGEPAHESAVYEEVIYISPPTVDVDSAINEILSEPEVVEKDVLVPGIEDAATGGEIKLIVIDPGHGGKDTGAIGRGGTKEKDITLAISKELARKLKKSTGARVLLTRATDMYITLEERTQFANKKKADIFISVHVNASSRKGADGIETYFLSFEASDDEARKTAAFENNVISLDGTVEEVPKDDIMAILWDLTQTESHRESSSLAELVYSRLIKAAGGEHRGVKQAPFRVLVGATMPSVLLEIGFISNPGAEKRLRTKEVQQRIAAAITDGIIDFEDKLKRRVGSFAARGEDEEN
ncbi:MAG: N-acetylmuramoyl-L-alanine amidase [Thermodesulfobacteriota bacterium]